MRWQRFHFEEKTTIVTLLCDPTFRGIAEGTLIQCRRVLEAYLAQDSVFGETHASYKPLPDAPEIVQGMCGASEKVEVGPMASVAGAFASAALDAMIQSGAKEAVVDNGGDIALQISESVRVGIFAGNSPIRNLAFEIEPREDVLGICTSSGTVGPSFSYGRSDAAIVLSRDVLLADAAATELGNRVRTESDLKSCFDFLDPIPEIGGALVILGDKMAMWGSLPKLIRAPIDETLITCGLQAK